MARGQAQQTQQRTILKANDYDSEEPLDVNTIGEEEGYDVTPETVHKANVEAQLSQLAKGQRDLATAMTMIAKSMTSSQLRKHAPMTGSEEPGIDDDAFDDVGGGQSVSGTFTGTIDNADEGMGAEESLSLSNGGYGNLKGAGRRKIAKDNDSTSFGEIDDDEPGNRQFDPANTKESDTVITGKPGAGPGPMGDRITKSLVDRVVKGLQDEGYEINRPSTISKSSSTPQPGIPTAADYTGSSINKAIEETGELVKSFAELSWHDLNRARVEMVPGTLLPFPIFGQPYGGQDFLNQFR